MEKKGVFLVISTFVLVALVMFSLFFGTITGNFIGGTEGDILVWGVVIALVIFVGFAILYFWDHIFMREEFDLTDDSGVGHLDDKLETGQPENAASSGAKAQNITGTYGKGFDP